MGGDETEEEEEYNKNAGYKEGSEEKGFPGEKDGIGWMILGIEHMEAAAEEFKFGLSCQMKGTKILQYKDQQYTSTWQDTFREVVLEDGHQIYSSG